MKKIYYFLAPLIMLLAIVSCTNEVTENIVATETQELPKLKTAGDGKYDVLGYGYDVTTEMYKVYPNSPTKYLPILDIQKFINANPGRFNSPSVSTSDANLYQGSNYINYKEDIIKKNKVNIGLWGMVENATKESTFNLDWEQGNRDIYSITSTDGYASVDFYQYIRRYFVDATPNELSKYLSNTFDEDLNKLSANEIIKKYGTHVLTDFTTGGIAKAKFKCSFTEEYQETQKTNITKGGLSLNLEKFGVSYSAENTTETKEYYTKKTNEWYFNIKIIGGSGNGLSYTIDSEGKSSTTVNLGDWSKSINTTNAEVVNINWGKTYPIYEFITDPTKKAQIKQAYMNYIDSKKVEMYEVRPLYRLYKPNNSFYTTYYDEALIYQNQYGYKWDADYTHYVQGYVFAKKYNDDMVPLYRLYKKGNSFYTTSYEEAMLHINKFGYKFDADHSPYIQGYVFAEKYKDKYSKDMVPLYRLYKGNSFYTTSYAEAQIYIKKYGYKYDADNSPYIQGYLIPYGPTANFK